MNRMPWKQKKQPETVKIVEPFVRLLRERGWFIRNITPGAMTNTVPDHWVTHKDYGGKWIEFKVRHGDSISLTPNQKKDFPLLMANGTDIWCVAAYDLRGPTNYHLRLKHYNRLFKEPNGIFMLNNRLYNQLF